MIRLSIVSYLNSRPFVYGLNRFKFTEEVEITEDIPSVCAEKLITGKADIGLVPVAALPFIPDYKIISDFCIGADGEVKSVLLLSDVPLNDITHVFLDYQSRTSVLLTRVLCNEYWKVSPEFLTSNTGYEKQITGSTAGVVIGDRALELRSNFKYAYDLAAEWKKMTSLPFVFACWVSNKELSEKFISEFNQALTDGLNHIDEIAANEHSTFMNREETRKYLTDNIQYNFDAKKKEALELFLKMSVVEKIV